MTWTLIVVLAQFNGFGHARAVSTLTVPGFTSQAACDQAGEYTRGKPPFDDLRVVAYCIPVR